MSVNRGRKTMRISNLMFDITELCNFRCKHCYKQSSKREVSLPQKSVVAFYEYINETFGTNNIVFSGGEPFLYKDLISIVKKISRRGAHIRINTNAFNLCGYVECLKEIPNLKIQISLDGYDKESFLKIRSIDAFEAVVKNAIYAKSNGIDVYFRTTVTRDTINNYEDFIKISQKYGIPLIMRPMVNTGELEQQKLAIDYPILKQWCEYMTNDAYVQYTSGHDLLGETSCPIVNDNNISILTVDARGNVYPCSLLRTHRFYCGNILCDDYNRIIAQLNNTQEKINKVLNCTQCSECGFRKEYGDGTCIVFCRFGNRQCINKIIE